MRAHGRHTGGFTSPAGIGCGATGAADAEDVVSAQNQPMIEDSRKKLCEAEEEATKGICCWSARGGHLGGERIWPQLGKSRAGVISLCTKQWLHADWLDIAQRVKVALPHLSYNLHHGIVRRSLYARDPPDTLFEPFVCPSCLASRHLAQLSCASGAEDGHDAKATVEQYHWVRNKTSHRSHTTYGNQRRSLSCEMPITYQQW